ncbi:hypothetical protein MTP99_002902 [Tenebrio molitor]|jgi:hypothetical protein|nr:hypothetical protein MTP99_002902 [Tenebrio molitor]
MVIKMRCSCKYRDALLQRKIRSSYFVLRSPRFGGNKKKPIVSGNEGTRSATAERAAVPQVAEKRITCVAIGIRNHPRERIADAMVLPGFGAVAEPEDFYRTDYRYRFTDIERPLVI